MKELGSGAFLLCENLETAVVEEGIEVLNCAFAECHNLKSVKLPSTLKTLVQSEFNTCFALESIELPENLETIGPYAFDRATALKSIVIPDSVTSIGKNAFQAAYALESITLPNGIKEIPESIFEHCHSLKSVEIPESVTTIGGNAFYYCSSLEELNLPESLTSIGEYAFYKCSSLEELTLHEGLSSIGKMAFEYCSSLKTVTLPQSLHLLTYEVFASCPSLTDVYLGDSVDFQDRSMYWQGDKGPFYNSNQAVIHSPNKYCATTRSAIHRDLNVDFLSVDRTEKTVITDERNSAYLTNTGSLITLNCSYAFQDEAFENGTNFRVLIRMPSGIDLAYCYLDGEEFKNYSINTETRVYSFNVSKQSGKIVIGASAENPSL